jgi:hypothetical protein
MAQDYDQLCSEASHEMMFANSPFLQLGLTTEAAITLLGSIQLSLRHPAVGENARQLLTSLADTIEEQLAALGPATRELCRQGWDPESDPEAA